jgi:hypothetical protein
LRNDITELVRPELRFDLRAALHLAFERNEPSLSLILGPHPRLSSPLAW